MTDVVLASVCLISSRACNSARRQCDAGRMLPCRVSDASHVLGSNWQEQQWKSKGEHRTNGSLSVSACVRTAAAASRTQNNAGCHVSKGSQAFQKQPAEVPRVCSGRHPRSLRLTGHHQSLNWAERSLWLGWARKLGRGLLHVPEKTYDAAVKCRKTDKQQFAAQQLQQAAKTESFGVPSMHQDMLSTE